MNSTNQHEQTHSNGHAPSTFGDIENRTGDNISHVRSEKGLSFDEFIEIVNTARSFSKVNSVAGLLTGC